MIFSDLYKIMVNEVTSGFSILYVYPLGPPLIQEMTKNVEYCETRDLRKRDTIVAARNEKEISFIHIH